jgi:hypothetical protein
MSSSRLRSTVATLFGFADPVPRAGGVTTYDCAFCGSCGTTADVPHTSTCTFWDALRAAQRLGCQPRHQS